MLVQCLEKTSFHNMNMFYNRFSGRERTRLTSPMLKMDAGRIERDFSHALTCTHSLPTKTREARITMSTEGRHYCTTCLYSKLLFAAEVMFKISYIFTLKRLSHISPISFTFLFTPVCHLPFCQMITNTGVLCVFKH